MKVLSLAFVLLAGTSPLPGASVSERMDRLEAKVSKMEDLLKDLTKTPEISPPTTNSPGDSTGHYQIRKGDSYWSIGRRHNVSVPALERANPGVNPRILSIGKKIRIPGRSRVSTSIMSTSPGTYRVRQGDILGRISEAHGIRLYQLLDANPGLDPRRLKIGSLLNIPGQTSQASLPGKKPGPTKPPTDKVPPRTDSPNPPTDFRPNPYLTESEDLIPEVRKLEGESPPIVLEEPRLITINEDRRLSEIAEQHKTTVAEINDLNNRDLSPRQMIKEGSQLYMPTR